MTLSDHRDLPWVHTANGNFRSLKDTSFPQVNRSSIVEKGENVVWISPAVLQCQNSSVLTALASGRFPARAVIFLLRSPGLGFQFPCFIWLSSHQLFQEDILARFSLCVNKRGVNVHSLFYVTFPWACIARNLLTLWCSLEISVPRHLVYSRR